ncbi:TadE family protein [Streptomonospora salina]|uniref:Flp pilus assembly protein TadG n=1 Tax=Streptomonospora salina TaxID=104205 RepID=A0A841EAS7_9ACTN|nr:pilus assembly protein [Streptomonospora salina]MBB5998439.1 Flp pilus assembly protein TadG [Streptomonospora salina]
MRSRDERGSTELVMALPVAFAMIMGVFQIGLWAHAQQRADAIAHQAVAAARTYDATAATGRRAGEQAITQLGGNLLRQPHVRVVRTPGQARATARADVLSIVPGWHPSVEAVARGPVERTEAPA